MTARPSLVLLAAGLLALGCGGDDDGGAIAVDDSSATTAAPANPDPRPAVQVVEVEVVDGAPVGGAADVDVPLGTMVSVQVTADVEDEVHVHGYDLTADAAPGTLAEVTFTADQPGQFEVELEGSGTLLATLVVS